MCAANAEEHTKLSDDDMSSRICHDGKTRCSYEFERLTAGEAPGMALSRGAAKTMHETPRMPCSWRRENEAWLCSARGRSVAR